VFQKARSETRARTKHAIGNGITIGWIGCPAICAVDLGFAMGFLRKTRPLLFVGCAEGKQVPDFWIGTPTVSRRLSERRRSVMRQAQAPEITAASGDTEL